MKRPRGARAPIGREVSPHRAAGAVHLRIAAVIGFAIVVLHALGAMLWPRSLWGAHAYAFLPPATLPVAVLLLAGIAGAGFLILRRAKTAVMLDERARVSGGPAEAGIAAAAFAVFWWARSRQILLGDGIPLTANLPYETGLHVREPLTSLVHQQVFRVASTAATGRDVHEIARDAVAFGSVLAGVLFVLIAIRLAGELLRLRPGPVERGTDRTLRHAVAGVLLAQGAVQLFFGYVENYAWEAAAIAAYLWLALRYLRGAAPLLAPIAALLLAVAFNLSSFTLAASLVVLAGVGLLRRGRRLAVARDLVAGAALAAGLVWVLQRVDPAYRMDQQLAAMLQKGAGSAAYLMSLEHVRDFFNEHVLIGPFALFWFLPVLIFALLTRMRFDPALLFLGVAGVVQAVALWMVADLPLGYARDWDLFAPFATVFTAAALGLVLARLAERDQVQRIVLVVMAVSLFHTAPWVALNASAERSLERFKHLPLGKGRTESTVGFWYFSQGNPGEARIWLERALAADPANVRAHAHLGNLHLAEGRYEDAERHFEAAVRMRPNQPMFRERLVRVLIAERRIEDALAHLAVLVEQEPARSRHWAMAAVLLYGGGRPIEAHEAMERAIQLAPGDSVYMSALQRMADLNGAAPEAYAALLEHEWPLILDR